ncbi:DUF3885 domain-containing protein [Staphylococcus chromogenes]|nr:DUF3885 domain-containing protein [Staphylococcus chromogenes]MDT0700388.1 DUF3885 domain-containing protein [Staphylococcus chromogenes]
MYDNRGLWLYFESNHSYRYYLKLYRDFILDIGNED